MAEPLQNVTFPSNDRQAFGYLASPASGDGPGVIVIQEWWGLTSHIASIVDRLAAEGFVALAPDLYGGPTTHDPAEAKELLLSLPVERAIEDLAGAVDHLLGLEQVTSTRLGVVGFCMGGGFVLGLAKAAGARIGAAIPFYGLPRPDFSPDGVSCAVQGHFGLRDSGVPVDRAHALFDDLAAAGANPVEFFEYDAGHAFVNDENLIGTYDAANAALAWGRAVAFLRAHVS